MPINDDDLLDYLIEGIPDRTLNNQVRIQCFTTKESLIDIFNKIVLHDQPSTKQTQQYKRGITSVKSTCGGKDAGSGKGDISDDKKWTARAVSTAIGSWSIACLSKKLSLKCFQCSEYIVSKCSKKSKAIREAYVVTQILQKKLKNF